MFYRLLSVVQRQRTSRGWQNWPSARSGASAAEAHSVTLPAQAQVVICGGGIMGTSVAYHLSKMGWKDIVLLEQGRLAAGSTRFCAGIISTARHLGIEQKMADYSNKLYQQLEQETGIQTGVQIYDRTSVVHVMIKKGEVTGVETDKGQIECQYFVNCTGQPLLSSLLRRMPDLETLEIMKLVNCPETFTPDMRCIMGESPLVKGYFVLAGMNSAGLSFGGGAVRLKKIPSVEYADKIEEPPPPAAPQEVMMDPFREESTNHLKVHPSSHRSPKPLESLERAHPMPLVSEVDGHLARGITVPAHSTVEQERSCLAEGTTASGP